MPACRSAVGEARRRRPQRSQPPERWRSTSGRPRERPGPCRCVASASFPLARADESDGRRHRARRAPRSARPLSIPIRAIGIEAAGDDVLDGLRNPRVDRADRRRRVLHARHELGQLARCGRRCRRPTSMSVRSARRHRRRRADRPVRPGPARAPCTRACPRPCRRPCSRPCRPIARCRSP